MDDTTRPAAVPTVQAENERVRVTEWRSAPGAATGWHVHEYDYVVVGILEPSGSAHDRALFSDLDSSWVLHAFDRHEMAGRHVHVGVDDLEEVDRAVTGILLKVPSRGGISAALDGSSRMCPMLARTM